jgi:hypothetical protein
VRLRTLLAASLLLALTSTAFADGEEAAQPADGPPPEPPVKVTTFSIKQPDVPEETMVGIMRALESGLKRNKRLEMRDLDSRLADFAQEVPTEQVENAKNALKEGQKALLELNIDEAVKKLTEACSGLAKVLPYIKKQELADAMASLAVALYEKGDKKGGDAQFVKLLTWRGDYLFDAQKFPPKYTASFEAAQKVIEGAKRGSIMIGSEPTGAQAYVDGKYIGVTPCPAEGLVVGTHYVTLKKEGYKKAVAEAQVNAKSQRMVSVNLEQSEKYLLVQQAIEKVGPTLGSDMGDESMDDLKQVLLIDHAVFVKAKGAEKIEVDCYLYDLRTRRRLARVTKTVPKAQAESQLAQLASNLYLGVNYDPELVKPKDAPPPQQLKRPSLFTRWWFWGAVVVVVGGIVAGIAIPIATQPPSCQPTDGCIHITQ